METFGIFPPLHSHTRKPFFYFSPLTHIAIVAGVYFDKCLQTQTPATSSSTTPRTLLKPLTITYAPTSQKITSSHKKMDSSHCVTANSPLISKTPSRLFGSCLVTITPTNSSMKMTFKSSLTKLNSVNPSCLEEIAELTKRQKEIRKEKNRITAKLSRDRKNAYIHSLETMLNNANSKIETLEKELCISCNQAMEITTPPNVEVKSEDDNNECLALDDLPPNLFDSDSE